MTHPREDLTAWIDGALAPERAAEVRAHLERCPPCREESERLRAGVAALAGLPPPPGLPPFFATRLEARLREERARPRGLVEAARGALERLLPRRRAALLYACAAAALLAALAVPAWHHLEDRRIARNLELLEDYETASAVELDSPDDVEIVAQLDQLSPGEASP